MPRRTCRRPRTSPSTPSSPAHPGPVAATTVVALAAVIPLSQLGHVAGVDDHNGAVNALALHLLGAGIWTGGIIVLALLVPLAHPPAHQLAPPLIHAPADVYHTCLCPDFATSSDLRTTSSRLRSSPASSSPFS